MAYCECGRKVAYKVRPTKRRGGRSYFKGGDKDHQLCKRCYRTARQQQNNARLAGVTVLGSMAGGLTLHA